MIMKVLSAVTDGVYVFRLDQCASISASGCFHGNSETSSETTNQMPALGKHVGLILELIS